MQVEIFKTDVEQAEVAAALVRLLLQHFPHCKINFDLEDCDRILRIQSANGYIDIERITQLVTGQHYTCTHFND